MQGNAMRPCFRDNVLTLEVYSSSMEKTPASTLPCGNYVVPPREVADELVASYWGHVHVLYPYLHRASFDRCFQRLWSTTQGKPALVGNHLDDGRPVQEYYSDERVFFCILNLVFALGCQYNKLFAGDERSVNGNFFFHRAQKFVNFDSLEQGHCALVQAFLLMGLYLQSTDKTEKWWNMVGLAIRVAQSIGLYIKPSLDQSSADVDQTEQEIRKRVWAGCILQDR